MLPGFVLNFLTGSSMKIVAHVVGTLMENKRQERLASMQAETNRIVAIQGGEDKADGFTKFTRRVLAFMLIGTLCFIMTYLIVIEPDTVFFVPVSKDNSWLLSIFSNTVEKDTIPVSAGSLIWDYKNIVEIVIGFYFTKIGKH